MGIDNKLIIPCYLSLWQETNSQNSHRIWSGPLHYERNRIASGATKHFSSRASSLQHITPLSMSLRDEVSCVAQLSWWTRILFGPPSSWPHLHPYWSLLRWYWLLNRLQFYILSRQTSTIRWKRIGTAFYQTLDQGSTWLAHGSYVEKGPIIVSPPFLSPFCDRIESAALLAYNWHLASGTLVMGIYWLLELSRILGCACSESRTAGTRPVTPSMEQSSSYDLFQTTIGMSSKLLRGQIPH